MVLKELKVKNFAAFQKLEFSEFQDINIIYGENGTGKSTFVEVFDFLSIIFKRRVLQKIASIAESEEKQLSFQINKQLENIDKCFTLGQEKNIGIEFKFHFLEKGGKYHIEYNKERGVVNEKLQYNIQGNKNNMMKTIFEVKDRNLIKLIPELKNFYNEYKYSFEAPKNKDSFIANVIYNQVESKNEEEKKILNMMTKFAFALDINILEESKFQLHSNILKEEKQELEPIIENKEFEESAEKITEQCEKFATFVNQIDSKVIDNKYIARKRLSGEEYYELVFVKKIGQNEIEVPYTMESKGTKLYLRIFNILNKIEKTNALHIIDEFGDGVHDALAQDLLIFVLAMIKKQKKQVIITTHNSSFMNIKEKIKINNYDKQLITNKNILLLEANSMTGERRLKNLAGIDVKDNKQKKYLEGKYGILRTRGEIFWEWDE